MAAGVKPKATINDVELDFSGLFSAEKQAEATHAAAPALLVGHTVEKPEPPISERMKKYKAIFREAYNFLERNNPPDQSEEYWEAACNDLTETGAKFPQDKLAADILLSIFEELERVSKEPI